MRGETKAGAGGMGGWGGVEGFTYREYPSPFDCTHVDV